MVLYRKYRPQKFAEVIGQEHIVRTLTNALSSGSFAHGYLFAGSRGLGKTALARIFAKTLNCTGRKMGKNSFEPCNKCIHCREITLGKSLDVIEIDAASNRGIDEIRELREKIRFAPSTSNYKVYIIDEVHMLTKEAFNALLKTLEEPPAHAIFVMATTEPHKVLPTILSRVQRFDFHKGSIKEIAQLLEKIATQEKIKIEIEAIGLLAQLAFGSYRDSLSLLGQVASVQEGNRKITLEEIQKILGLAQEKSVFEFVASLALKNRKKLFEIISKLYLQGIDLENFTVKLVEILRKIALWKLGEDQLFDLTREQQSEVKKLAEAFELDLLMLMIEKFVKAINQIKSAPLPQLPLEMLVYEFTADEVPAGNCQLPTKETKNIENIEKNVKESPTSFQKDLWLQVIKGAKTHNNHLAALLKDAVLVETNDDVITLAFKFKFHAEVVSGRKNTQLVESIIEKITGTAYQISCKVDPALVIKAPLESEEELLNGAKEVFEVEE